MAAKFIQPRSGAYAHLRKGQMLKIVNTHGTQVVDTWAFARLSASHEGKGRSQLRYLSMCHTISALRRLGLEKGDILRDNGRQEMLRLVEDTSGGGHDMVFAACDEHRYAQLGVEGYHASCVDNLHGLISDLLRADSRSHSTSSTEEPVASLLPSIEQIPDGWTPTPLNLFMNVPVKEGGELVLAAPNCPKGGHVTFKAEMECVVFMSACPMDIVGEYENVGVEFAILEAGSSS